MQVSWNKRKFLHEKTIQSPKALFGRPTWPPPHCFVHQYGRRDVMWKRSPAIFSSCTKNSWATMPSVVTFFVHICKIDVNSPFPHFFQQMHQLEARVYKIQWFIWNCPPEPHPHFFMFAQWSVMRERSIDLDMVFDAILTSKQGNLGAVTKLYINILKFRSY